LDRSLLEARRLLDQAIATYRDEVSAAPLARLSAEPAVILRYRKSLIDRASDSVLCAFPAEPWHSDVLQAAIARAVRRGVKGAMLFSGPPPQDGHGTLAEMRSIERELPDLMVVDESIAIVGVGPSSIEVSDRACIDVLGAMFRAVWGVADRVRGAVGDDCQQCRVSALILRSLADGATDETGAQRLGMSVRTYRRHVARIMGELQAMSRFQAGLRLAREGMPCRHEPT
jgi:hypothetical protein